MTPYYEENGITIYNADCRDVLPSLSGVQMIFRGPSLQRWQTLRQRHGGCFINQIIWRHQVGACDKRRFWPNYQPILMYGKTQDWKFHDDAETDFSGKLRFGAYKTEPKGRLKDTWDDVAMVFSGAIHHKEAILATGTANKAHPCQMPTTLSRRCIRFSCSPGDTVVDPFMGSGATLEAAKDGGYKAIGIEIEERYCEIAANRLRQEVLSFEPAQPLHEMSSEIAV